jgi:hypothetical protein
MLMLCNTAINHIFFLFIFIPSVSMLSVLGLHNVFLSGFVYKFDVVKYKKGKVVPVLN